MRFILGSLSLLLASFHGASGQTIGVELCACSPSYYEFTLNFDLFCPPVNITENDAVDDTSCVITPFSSTNVTDLVPVVVESIDILELGQGLRVLVQENIAGTFVDGDTFNYTSLTATSGEIEDTADVPRGLQINIVASNKFNEPLINVFILTFTNNCGAYPVIQEGQSAGWTVFTALEPPLREYCPFGETDPPTGAPAQGGATGGPTTSPTGASTDAATPSPTVSPSGSPTASPVDEAATTGPTGSTPVPTVPPVEEASEPPTNAPTLIIPVPDTPSPTSAPVVTTDAPTTMAPVEAPTAVPVTSAPVTAAPTVLPTIATEAPIAMSMSMSMSMSMMYGDHDYIMEEFGLFAKKEKAKDSTAKLYKGDGKLMKKEHLDDSKGKEKVMKSGKEGKSRKSAKSTKATGSEKTKLGLEPKTTKVDSSSGKGTKVDSPKDDSPSQKGEKSQKSEKKRRLIRV